MAILKGSQVWENDEKLVHELAERCFGTKIGNSILLSAIEARYLLEKKKISLEKSEARVSKKRSASFPKTSDKQFENLYAVYKDLRSKGYIIRTGPDQFLRVYEKGTRVGEGHSAWIVQPIDKKWKADISDISRAVNVAHSVRKKMIFALVEGKRVSYYKLERMAP